MPYDIQGVRVVASSLEIYKIVKSYIQLKTKFIFSVAEYQGFNWFFGNVNHWKPSIICDQASILCFHGKCTVFNSKVPPSHHANAPLLLHPLIPVILSWPPQSVQRNYACVLLCLLLQRSVSLSDTPFSLPPLAKLLSANNGSNWSENSCYSKSGFADVSDSS